MQKEIDRVPSHIGAANGTIHPASAGVVYFRWDNSYSWLTAKELTYLVEVATVDVQPQQDFMMRTPLTPRRQSVPVEDANASAMAAANAAAAAAAAVAQAEVVKLRREIEALMPLQGENSQQRREIESLTQQLAALRSESAKDKEELSYLREKALLQAPRDEGAADRLASALQENARLESELQVARAGRVTATQDLSRAERQRDMAHEAMQEVQAKATHSLSAAEKQRARDKNDILTLRATIEGLTAKEALLTSELTALRSNVRSVSPPRREPPSNVTGAPPSAGPKSPQLEHVVNVSIVDPTVPVSIEKVLEAGENAQEARGEGAFQSPPTSNENAAGMNPFLVPVNAMLYGITLGNVNPWGHDLPEQVGQQQPSMHQSSENDSSAPVYTAEGLAAWAVVRQQQELQALASTKPPRPDGARDLASSAPLKGILKRGSVGEDTPGSTPKLGASDSPRSTPKGVESRTGILGLFMGSSTVVSNP